MAQSGAAGEQLKEAQNINRSLSELGNVVNALRLKQNHVPFRNSQLTRFLENSLSGDSKTVVIVQVAPGKNNLAESISSLNFAQKICQVELPPTPTGLKTRFRYSFSGATKLKHSNSSTAVIHSNNTIVEKQ